MYYFMFATHFFYDRPSEELEHGPHFWEVYYRASNGDLILAKPNSREAGYKRLRHLGNALVKV